MKLKKWDLVRCVKVNCSSTRRDFYGKVIEVFENDAGGTSEIEMYDFDYYGRSTEKEMIWFDNKDWIIVKINKEEMLSYLSKFWDQLSDSVESKKDEFKSAKEKLTEYKELITSIN